MNMSKKILLCITIIFSLFFITKNVHALTQEKCSTYDEATCNKIYECTWRNYVCQPEYVAQSPCSENRIKKVLRFFGYLLLIAKIIVPLIIIGFASFDLFKSVIDKDEKSLSKQLKQVGVRVATGIVIFFIPSIVNAAISFTGDETNKDDYKTCASCLLTPTDVNKCNVEEI